MNKVYIFFDNYKYKLVIVNLDSKIMSIDEDIIHVEEKDIDRFIYIMSTLKEKKNGNIIDPVRYTISYSDSDDSISGNSNTCKNFNLLNDWLGEIYAR